VLTRPYSGELIRLDQVVVGGMVEELPHRLLDVGALGSYPCQRLCAGEAVDRPIAVFANELPEPVT
jgi:hypothetical protein